MKYIYTKEKVLFNDDIVTKKYEEGLSLFFKDARSFDRFIASLKKA